LCDFGSFIIAYLIIAIGFFDNEIVFATRHNAVICTFGKNANQTAITFCHAVCG
jgi:hypothetical protein